MLDLATAAVFGMVTGAVAASIAMRGQFNYARHALAQVRQWQDQNDAWFVMRFGGDGNRRATQGDAPSQRRSRRGWLRLRGWLRRLCADALAVLRRPESPPPAPVQAEVPRRGWVDGVYYPKHWPAGMEHTTEIPRIQESNDLADAS